LSGERKVLPLEVRGVDDGVSLGMNLTGGGDANAGHPRGIGGIHEAGDHALEGGDDARRTFPGFGLHFETADELAGRVQEPAAQLAATQVNTDGVAIGRREQSRGIWWRRGAAGSADLLFGVLSF